MRWAICMGVIGALCVQQQRAQACVPWGNLQRLIKQTWTKSYSGDQVLSMTRSGQPRKFTKKVVEGKRVVTKRLCSQAVKVKVKRANGSQASFNSTWNFELKGGRYAFTHQAIGAVEEKAAAGEEAPPKDEVKKLIAAAWVREVEKTDKVSKVLMTKLQKKTGAVAYGTLVDVYVTARDGKKQVCKDYRVTVYKGKQVSGARTSFGTGKGPWAADFLTKRKYGIKCKPQ